MGSVIYLQEFVPHCGFDLRLLWIDGEVLAMKRINPDDWRTNMSQGSRAERFEPQSEHVQMAARAVDAIGGPLLAVDILPGVDGQNYVSGGQRRARVEGPRTRHERRRRC